MDSSSPPRLLFDKLLPIRAVLFSKDPIGSRHDSVQIKDKLNDLLAILEDITDMETCSVELYRYITDMLVAALLRIKKANTFYENVVEAWLKCMCLLVGYPQWQLGAASGPLFQQLLIVFSNMIAPPASSTSGTGQMTASAVETGKSASNRHVPEEIQHLAVKCITAILPTTDRKPEYDLMRNINLVIALRDLRFRPQISYCIMALLDVALKADLLPLRLDAMHTLAVLLLDNLEEKDIIATALPRIVSTLCRIILQKKEKENHRIIVAALTLLGDVIVAVLQDSHTPDYMIPNVISFKDLANVGIAKRPAGDDDSNEKDDHERTRAWYNSTKEKIKENLDRILTAQSHQEWRARLAFVRFASKLLVRCVRTLDNCVPDLLKTMVLHIDDEYREVANECKFELQIVMKSQSLDQVIIPTLKTNLYSAVAGLPRCLIAGDEGDKVHALALITGYVLVLGPQAENVLNRAISRYSDAWIAALAIDENGMNVLDEALQSSNKYAADLQDDGMSPIVIYPKIRFKHLISDRTAERATRMFNVIGRTCNLSYWINHFKDFLRQDEWKPQAAYMIHALLSGANSTEAENDDWWMGAAETDNELSKEEFRALALQTLHDIVDLVIDPVSEPERMNKTVVPGGRHRVFGSHEMETAHVLSICFSLQIIGLTAVVLKRKYMQDELITLLYPLLAHLGSPNVHIHSYALITLDVIALICGLQGAKQLALDNADYVINMVTQRMTSLADNLQGPLVLKAMVRIGGLRMIDFLGDTVEEIFDALDRFHMNDWMCAQLCSVLTEIVLVHHKTQALLDDREFVEIPVEEKRDNLNDRTSCGNVSKEIQEFIAERELKKQQQQQEPEEATTMDEIGRYFMERQQQKVDGQDKSDDSQEPAPSEEAQIPLTKAQQMTVGIMQKAYHFLAAPSPYLRTEILGLLGAGATVMKDRPEKLGPFIATAWPSIVSRLSENDANHTVLQAVVCIGQLAECLDDYMSRKFVDDVWPKLKARLRRQNDGNNDNPQYYSPFSYVFKLHQAILQTIRTCIDHVYLPSAKVPEIAEETKRFLNERLHPDLQESAINMFLSLGRRQPDVVWLCLLSLLGERAFVKDEERVFLVPEWMCVNDKYLARNAQRLLGQIMS